MLNFKKHIEAESMLNTPPVFAVIMCNIVLKWMIQEGGVQLIEERNKRKAKMLYDEIDKNSLLEGFAQHEDRSLMNATFKLKDEQADEAFTSFLKSKGIIGINGHRSKGGYRVSMYNMLPESHVHHLVKSIQEFSG